MINEKHRKAVYEELRAHIMKDTVMDKMLYMSQMTARQLFDADFDSQFKLDPKTMDASFCGIPIKWKTGGPIELWCRGSLLYSIVWDSDPDKKASDPINPDHYKAGGIEVIDILRAKFTKDQFEGFLMGNVIKYTLRAGQKNGKEDLKKATWYSSMLAGVDPRQKPTT